MTKGIYTPNSVWKGKTAIITIGEYVETIEIQDAGHYWKLKRLEKAKPNIGRN